MSNETKKEEYQIDHLKSGSARSDQWSWGAYKMRFCVSFFELQLFFLNTNKNCIFCHMKVRGLLWTLLNLILYIFCENLLLQFCFIQVQMVLEATRTKKCLHYHRYHIFVKSFYSLFFFWKTKKISKNAWKRKEKTFLKFAIFSHPCVLSGF